MNYSLQILAVLFALIGCSSMETDPPDTEYFQRPSSPEYLVASDSDPATLTHIDSDLSRHYWAPNPSGEVNGAYAFAVVVTPLTRPLLRALFYRYAHQGLMEESEIAVNLENMVFALAEKQSCFDIFLKSPERSGKQSELDQYRIVYRNAGSRPQRARPLISRTRYLSFYVPARQLIEVNLPVKRTPGSTRGVEGLGSFMRELVCGVPIDFSKPFEVSIQPIYSTAIPPAVLRWNYRFAE